MNHLPEKLADDNDQPPPPTQTKKSPAASPAAAAVSFGNDIHHRYYDNNAAPEKEQSSSSSSDSDSDDDDFFQIEATELAIPAGKPPTAPVFMENEIGLSAKYAGWKPPPPARYDVPDPNRIPMSVFARNPAAAAAKDWSVASNESLFSIQMGNSSFSREQGLFLMGRSGELGNGASWPSEYPPPRPTPTRAATEAAAAAGGKEMLAEANEVKKEEQEEEMVVVVVEGPAKEKSAGHLLGHSISRQSDCSSTTSFRSFAFPVLTRDEKNESIRVMARQHTEHQPPPLINAQMAATPPPVAATGPWAPSTTGAISAKRRWFPCFTWCGLCC